MRTCYLLTALAAGLGVEAAVAPSCRACKQDACMDSVVKAECGQYLVIVETPPVQTVSETIRATVMPTETAFVTFTPTVIRDVTTFIPVTISTRVDFTTTITEPRTATVTETKAATVTLDPPVPRLKRRRVPVIPVSGLTLPTYAVCSGIQQYSSACSCLRFVPSTRTLSASISTVVVSETQTLATNTVVSTSIATPPVTVTRSIISVTQPVATETISTPGATDTVTTIVATDSVTIASTTTVTRAPEPTVTGRISAPGGRFLQDRVIPTGSQIGAGILLKQTTTPAIFTLGPKGFQLIQNPPTTYPYYLFYGSTFRTNQYEWIQVASETVGQILGLPRLQCDNHVTNGGELVCKYNGQIIEFWTCGENLYAVMPGQGQAFQAGRNCNVAVEWVPLYFNFL